MSDLRVSTLPDRARAMEAAAFSVSETLLDALEERDQVHLMLAGGTTPAALYQALTAQDEIPWEQVVFWFGDERAVPPDHADSNYRMVKETLFDPLGISPAQIHRMEAEDPDLDAAAARYAQALPDRVDLLLLGIGEDGHIASLFPGSPALDAERKVVSVAGTKPPPRRLSVTPPVIAAARDVLVLACGEGKATAVFHALQGDLDADACPARLVRGAEWVLDASAAALLKT